MILNKENTLLAKAENLAYTEHGYQMYDIHPYKFHLQRTYSLAKKYKLSNNVKIATILHDILEDTDVTYSHLLNEFGYGIAELVYLVTDELGRNRYERKEKTLQKIITYKDSISKSQAIELKFCDRIANLEYSVKMQNIKKCKLYCSTSEQKFMMDLIQNYNGIESDLFNYYSSLILDAYLLINK